MDGPQEGRRRSAALGGAISLVGVVNLINLENVSKAYGPSPLLDAVSLGVADGERIGVVGRNGGGKSTLVSVLAKLTRPDAGRVTHSRDLRVGCLGQRDDFAGGAT